jgi:hypothetical protein
MCNCGTRERERERERERVLAFNVNFNNGQFYWWRRVSIIEGKKIVYIQ